MRKYIHIFLFDFGILMFAFYLLGCSQQTTTSDNGIPFPSKEVIFQLDEFESAYSASGIKTKAESTRAKGLVSSAYAQAGIDLGYFEGFDPVLSSFRSASLTAVASNEYKFSGKYADTISFEARVDYVPSTGQYIVKVWGIRPGESAYRRWFYADLLNSKKGYIIIDPYIMWTSTHDYPMTIKFNYDATQTSTKICSGGATGQWSSTSSIDGSTYFYCKEDDTDSSNTVVTFMMYQTTINPVTSVVLTDKLYGKFNRDKKLLHGRDWTNGYSTPDSGLLYVNTETYSTLEGTVSSNIDASSMTFVDTPEAGFAAFPDTTEFPNSPAY